MTSVFFFCSVLLAIVVFSAIASPSLASLAPAAFIFGDSLVDTGNNNYISTLAKGNIKFNGVDFGDGQPNGRFCNGKTVLDILCGFIGLPSPPVYLDPTARGAQLLQGVNYASGAAGILPSTGYLFIGHIFFGQQLLYFQNTISELAATVGQQQASELLSQSVFFVVFGSNDYINNYLAIGSPFQNFTPGQYQDLLVSTYVDQLTTLYHLGARKIMLTAVGPIGCIPFEIAYSFNPDETCVASYNSLAANFNAAARVATDKLQAQFPDSRFTTANAYGVFEQILADPAKYGFKYSNAGCCGTGNLRGMTPCTPSAQLCDDRPDYVFWDAFHPSEKANYILANAFFSGSQDDISPLNIQQLLATP